MEDTPWFASWFDSPFYHKLYSNRSDAEARAFIKRLVAFLDLEQHSSVLDLACGKGRHAQALFDEGLQVTGVDLSPNSISRAKQDYEKDIRFEVGDMRDFDLGQRFDAVFNLFTSFGYFDDTSDNARVLARIHAHLELGGRLAIDFLNADKVTKNLLEQEEKQVEGTRFQITRRATETHIYKDIRFQDQGQDFHYTERVQALNASDMINLVSAAGFTVNHTFGSYSLQPYAPEGDRLIIIATKLH